MSTNNAFFFAGGGKGSLPPNLSTSLPGKEKSFVVLIECKVIFPSDEKTIKLSFLALCRYKQFPKCTFLTNKPLFNVIDILGKPQTNKKKILH